MGFAVIDKEDAPVVEGLSWHLESMGYPAHSIGQDRRVRMHTYLLRPPAGMEVDHMNGDKLDNRRANLRVVTKAQNLQNVRTAKGDMRGVYLDRRDGRWYGQVKHRGVKHGTGRFRTAEEARDAVVALRLRVLPYSDPDLRP